MQDHMQYFRCYCSRREPLSKVSNKSKQFKTSCSYIWSF
uniref:Uncharacterized protein n=1 Tax=Schistosoma japonicum TaxID=6182 RepID=Q5C5R3_SCHJA|nr:unknown [Schistosoma japonicum]